jgi:membrane protease YdiL (CAAX protease family)
VVAGLAVLPLVYLMMAAVNLGFKTQYNHPLLEEMKASATIVSYLLGVLTAAVVAPVVEEFLFRVLIQGWLQSIPFRSLGASLMGATQTEQPVPVATNNYEEPLAVTSLAPAEADEALTNNGLDQRPADEAGFSQKTVPPWWPAIATGILFGLAHWGYGLSFLPLIVLGIFLGLLYRATQSIWPCIIVHCMLNSSSMLALGIALLTDHVSQ